jgi:hypothetical protein
MTIVASLAAGCARPMDVATITDIRASNGAAGLDVYAERRRKGEKVPDLSGDQVVDVRSYTGSGEPGSEIAGDEMAGAKCVVKARDYSAHVTTPARIRVPLYRAQSSPLSVTCERDGYRPASGVAEVYNKTKEDRYAAGSSGGGLIGLALMAAVNELSDEAGHEFKYRPAYVVMLPIREVRAGKQ